MAHVDAVMVGELGIGLIQMMENAGRSLAEVAITAFSPASVTVLAGTGGGASTYGWLSPGLPSKGNRVTSSASFTG